MRRISYSKFSEEDLGIEMDDVLRALADYLLGSGFQDPYLQFSEMNQHTLEELRRAIEQALESGDLFNPEQLEQMRRRLEQMSSEQRQQLIQRLINKLEEGGYINRDGQQSEPATAPGGEGGSENRMKF
jgi:Ca-activated chloride channel homolog